jgi:nucleoside-diphosphate-sugar epimerase
MPVSLLAVPMIDAVITGATGFVGQALLQSLPGARALSFGATQWRDQLRATDLRATTVFHLAARVHRPRGDDDAAYVHDNVDKTMALAQAAAAGGARGFVFVSSIKVNGEETRGVPFTAGDAPAPEDAYGRSKWAAEQALRTLSLTSGLPVHIVRPCLVYGPRAVGNLRALVRLCDSGVPLPFGALRNRRSFIALDDLVSLLVCCGSRPMGLRTWLAGHPHAISTRDLVTALRSELGRPARLVPCPAWTIELAARAVGRSDEARRLTRSLELDPSPAMGELGWSPRVSLQEAVAQVVHASREP